MINLYNAPTHTLTPAVQDAAYKAMRHMCIQEGWLDSKGIPTPHDGGVWRQDNEMTFVAYVADLGGVEYHTKGPKLRELATTLGYTSSANCKAMVLECTGHELLKARILSDGVMLEMTSYGWETLARWEAHKADEA